MSRIGEYLESVFSLEGKIILMTGAAGGLGAAMAEALAKAGGSSDDRGRLEGQGL